MQGHHCHLANFFDIGCHVLLGLYIFCFPRNFHVLHSLGILAVVQLQISDAWPESSSASAAVLPTTADAYSEPCLPHVRVVPKQSQESRLGVSLVTRIIVVLPPHHTLC